MAKPKSDLPEVQPADINTAASVLIIALLNTGAESLDLDMKRFNYKGSIEYGDFVIKVKRKK